MPILLLVKKNLNYFEKKCGDEITFVQCPFNCIRTEDASIHKLFDSRVLIGIYFCIDVFKFEIKS